MLFATANAEIYISGDGSLDSAALKKECVIIINIEVIDNGIKNLTCSNKQDGSHSFFKFNANILISPLSTVFEENTPFSAVPYACLIVSILSL